MTPTEQRKEWRAIAEKATVWISFLDQDKDGGDSSGEVYRARPNQGPMIWQSSFEAYVPKSTFIGLLDELDLDHSLVEQADKINEQAKVVLKENKGLFNELTAAQARIKALEELVAESYDLLEIATDLLPVPEHAQDDYWYERQNDVFARFMKLRAAREKGEDLLTSDKLVDGDQVKGST